MCYNYKKILAKMPGNSYKLDLMGKLISSFIFQNWVPLFMFCFLIKSSFIDTMFLKL